MPELAIARLKRARGGHRIVTVGGYLVLVLGFFLAGFLLAPTPDVDKAPAWGLERTRLPHPLPVGEFRLREAGVSDDSDRYDRDRLLGQWTLMYFGYRHCPDICRPTLGVLAEVARRLRSLPGWKARLELAFVSVDPARDTPALLRTYVSSADAGIVAVHGSEKQVAGLAQQVGILYSHGEPDGAGHYLVDHPATILLIDPGAQLRAGFPLPHDPGWIVEQILDIEHAFDVERAG